MSMMRELGYQIGRFKVRNLMKEAGLASRQPGAHRYKVAQSERPDIPNLLTRAHGALLQLTLGLVMVAELGIAVTAVGIALGVLLPEQLFGDPLTLELLMYRGPIRYNMAGRDGGIGLRIEQGSQSAIIKLGR